MLPKTKLALDAQAFLNSPVRREEGSTVDI